MRKAYMIGSKTAADKNYFCVTPVNGSAQVGWYASSVVSINPPPLPPTSLEYSFDRTQWTAYTLNTDISITGPIYFRGDNDWFISTINGGRYTYLKLTALCDLSGRINSLSKKIVYDAAPTPMPVICKHDTYFYGLFKNNTYIRSVKDLILNWDAPAISEWYGQTYADMFSGCASLIDTPVFAGAIGDHGCIRMFKDCVSLTTIYDLPAPTVENQYTDAFANCMSLQTAPAMHSTLTARCYHGMFSGCTSLTQVPSLPAETLTEGCYLSMFYGCTGLTVLPDLSNDNLPSACYKQMFFGIGTNPSDNRILSASQTGDFQYEFAINATTAAADATDKMFSYMSSGDPASYPGSSPEINTTYYSKLPTAQSQR